ncbi:hypothetical protein [Austwickia chelonae]|uniref:hypothetical protein n=1 Tax=Austwickia chelonae TaxID=100225 RepID=UPI0013C2F518|nr:hypothetical protein [Austwickia chelonae]
MTHRQPTSRAGWWRLLLATLATTVAVLLGSGATTAAAVNPLHEETHHEVSPATTTLWGQPLNPSPSTAPTTETSHCPLGSLGQIWDQDIGWYYNHHRWYDPTHPTFITTGITPPAAKTGNALVKYDTDFAVDQITQGGRATASQLDEFGTAQEWLRSQTATGPVKYTDSNEVVRLTIKQGGPRAPGSAGPHVEIRNAGELRIDPYDTPVTRRSPGNHTPIEWDW